MAKARTMSNRTGGIQRRPGGRRSILSVFIFYLFFIPFVLGGLYFGYVFAYTMGLLGDDLEAAIGAPPVPFVAQNNVPAWSGQDRLNILLLGLDQRDDEVNQPSRSDTLIVLTIDPVGKTAAMLSIPRDLWVPIPGIGENKINTAHFFGEEQKRGNGPLLAKKTIENNFGIPIHYYARVNFRGFERLVDAIGGIDIDAPKPVLDDEYPLEGGGIKRLYVPAGWQHMGGQLALEYARSRHSDSDFGRSQRQQQVIVAAKDKALRVDMWPKLPGMIGILRESVTTDIPATSMLSIANLVREIDSGNITNAAIDGDMVTVVNNPDIYYLEPNWPEINQLVSQLFAVPAGADQPVEQTEPARIQVLNGTDRVGIAARTSAFLRDKGYVLVRYDNADEATYEETVIIDHAGKQIAAKNIARLLGVPASCISEEPGDSDDVDITIILGEDAQLPSDDAP